MTAPKYFPLAYQAVKPFLAEETARKVSVYADTWREKLLLDIEESELPSHWGGLKVDPVDGDPRCPSLVCMGGQVPCSYYTAPSRRLSIDYTMNTIVVDKKTFKTIEVNVQVPGTCLKWEFKTEENDIGFCLYRQRNIEELHGPHSGDDEDDVIPFHRVNSHLVPEDGMVVVPKIGRYIFKFDNTYSWYRNKRVMYRIEVLPPKKDKGKKNVDEEDDDEEEEASTPSKPLATQNNTNAKSQEGKQSNGGQGADDEKTRSNKPEDEEELDLK